MPATSVYLKGLQVQYLVGPAGKALFFFNLLYILGYLSYLVWPYMALPPQGALYFWSTFKALLPLSIIYLAVLQVTALGPTLISTIIGVATIVGSIAQVVSFLVGALVTGSYTFRGNYLSFFIYTCVLLALEVAITALTLVVRTERRRHEQKQLRDEEAYIRKETGYDVYIPGSGSVTEKRLRNPTAPLSDNLARYRSAQAAGLLNTKENGTGDVALTAAETEDGGREDQPPSGIAARIGYHVNRITGEFVQHLDSRVPHIVRGPGRAPAPGRSASRPGGYSSSVDWSHMNLR